MILRQKPGSMAAVLVYKLGKSQAAPIGIDELKSGDEVRVVQTNLMMFVPQITDLQWVRGVGIGPRLHRLLDLALILSLA